MPIVAADIKVYLSGGGTNADPNAALGGVVSSVQLVDNTLHNLFDKVTGAEAAAGDIEYRCVFIRNTHATLTLEGAKVFINSNTTSGDTSVEIAVSDEAGFVGTVETIANENTAPVGPVFTTANSMANGISLGDLTPGSCKAIWIKWIVSAAAVAVLDSVTLEVFGDTNP
ncbi:MAG: hypothetical protein ACD_5C00016G0005 [uncultured bacterium]|nr:MAG: hypothetical protein ACD_5C00016G0005 [uncultured bacterium]